MTKIAPGKIVKRLVEAFTKNYFFDIVTRAYQHPNCDSHEKIKYHARRFFGIDKSKKNLFDTWFMDFVCQAQYDLFKRHRALNFSGITPLGFENLQLEWSSTDANSSIVYLFGFGDNFTRFELIKKYVRPGTMVVDVGANLGIHTLVMSTCAGNSGQCLSLEPLPSIYSRLVGNIELNRLSICTPINKGAGAVAEKVRFNTNAGDFNIGKGSVAAQGDREIELTTIDELVRGYNLPVSFIKIDTEGHEYQVIQGAHETLSKYKPVIMCEFNFNSYSFSQLMDIIPFKAEFFTIPETYHEKTHIITPGIPVQGDLLILPR